MVLPLNDVTTYLHNQYIHIVHATVHIKNDHVTHRIRHADFRTSNAVCKGLSCMADLHPFNAPLALPIVVLVYMNTPRVLA